MFSIKFEQNTDVHSFGSAAFQIGRIKSTNPTTYTFLRTLKYNYLTLLRTLKYNYLTLLRTLKCNICTLLCTLKCYYLTLLRMYGTFQA